MTGSINPQGPSAPQKTSESAPITPSQSKQASVESEASSISQSFSSQSNTTDELIKGTMNNDPAIIPPQAPPSNPDELKEEIGSNPWFQKVDFYIRFYENLTQAAELQSRTGFVESQIFIDALDAEWELGQQAKGLILESAKKEFLMHILQAGFGIATGASSIISQHAKTKARSKAEKDFNNQFGENGTVTKEIEDLKNSQQVAQESGEVALPAPTEELKKLEQQKKNAIDNKAHWVFEKQQEYLAQPGLVNLLGRMDSNTLMLFQQTLNNAVQGPLKILKAQEDAMLELTRTAQKINPQLMQGALEQRKTSLAQVAEILRNLTQVLTELRRTMGTITARKG